MNLLQGSAFGSMALFVQNDSNLDIAELKEIAKLLRVTANNVNQIARRVNSGGEAYRGDVAGVKRQLEEIRIGFGKILAQLAELE